MRCADFQELLDLYIDGDLPEETRARLERHLLRCAECAFQARTLEQTRVHLREAYPHHETTPAFREKMSARLQDAFQDRLRPEPEPASNQWPLPFLLPERFTPETP
jgi:anti-sigma factor RsiW